MRHAATCLLILASTSLVARAEPVPSTPEQIEFFEKQVRPVLAARCHSCHGPNKQESSLRLDSRAALLHGIDGSAVVAPGEPEKSRLIAVIRYDADVQMPPAGKLPENEIATLTAWIKMGLPWPAVESTAAANQLPAAPLADMNARLEQARAKHWSLQPVKLPSLPEVADASWCANEIDRFVLAEQEKRGLTPSSIADKRTLLRRATFDLVGLPPTPEEQDAFLADDSPAAYAELIDRLLDSPLYGERWGRHWLDVARYADTKGYVFTQEPKYPFSYTYRDYVIRSLNEDLPYDRFVTEQLAADLLPSQDDKRPLAALGFLTVGRRFSNNPHDIIDDRIDVVTRGLQGLTVTCARCHDHKFDAIPTADYYSLYGVFASCNEPDELPQIAPAQESTEYQRFVADLAAQEKELQEFLLRARRDLAEELRTNVGDYLGRIVIEKLNAPNDNKGFAYSRGEPRTSSVRRWNGFLERTARQPEAVFAVWHRLASVADPDFAPKAAELATSLADSQPPSSLLVNRLVREALIKTPPKTAFDLVRLYESLFTDVHGQWQERLAKEPDAKHLDDAAVEELRQVLYGEKSPATFSESDAESLFDRATRGKLTELKKKIEALKANSPAAPPRAMVLVDNASPNDPHIFVRGNPGRGGAKVPRQYLAVVAGSERKPFAGGSGRLELADAIADRSNPLTARVMVNRVWQQHFGTGLVATASDFGVRSEPPSHPELLDYLAHSFMDEGWSLKRLHRRIMLSSTYRQASHVDAAKAAVDNDNRWLWRANRRRLEFEAVRDSLLAVSGRLDPAIGGRPVDIVKPPYSNRRTVYGLVDRQDLPDVFRAFDFASPDVSTELRPRTTVPQQALFVMNSPFAIEQAKRLAARPEVQAAFEPADRIRVLCKLALAKDADAVDLDMGRQFIRQQTENANDLLPDGARPLDPWEQYAQALLLSNEFMFVD